MEEKKLTPIFFWSHDPKIKHENHEYKNSQWYQVTIKDDDGVEYICNEQYMMAHKAKLFKDNETYEKIMKAKDPKAIKSLGREVKNFDGALWDEHKYEIVKQANMYKYSQHDDLKKLLLDSGSRELVESSPFDKIWGIGYDKGQALKVDRSKWGLNLLGKALMDVRETLKNKK